MSENYFEDARTFNPWRWAKKVDEDETAKNVIFCLISLSVSFSIGARVGGPSTHSYRCGHISLSYRVSFFWLQEEDGKQKTAAASDKKRWLFLFGGGPRLCPGYELSRLELCVFLHYLVTHFTWDAAAEDSMVFFPTTRTVKGLPIRVRHRSN